MKQISIAKYSDSFQANIAKTRLENAGIYCRINNENLINTVWMSSEVVGGLELMVYEEDAEKAAEILEISFDFDEDTEFITEESGLIDSEAIKCPKCGSLTVLQSVRPAFLSFVLNFINFRKADSLVSVCECSKCGNKWKL